MAELARMAGRGGKAISTLEVVGGAGAIAYANHRYGAGEIKLGAAADGTGGVPADGALGLAGIAFAFWKPHAKMAPHAMHLGLGFLSGFAYRVGAAKGDAAAQTVAATHTTAGQSAIASRPIPQLSAAFAAYSNPSRVAQYVAR